MEVDPDKMQGVVKTLPARNDIVDVEDIKEQLIVELYSR
jgi:ribosomal protein S4